MPVRFLDEKTPSGGRVRFLDEEPASKPVMKKGGAPAYGGLEGAKRLIAGGPTGYFSASGSEDVLPAVGQAVGGMIPGAGFQGSVAGSTVGQGARQAIKAIRGTRDSQPRKIMGIGPKAPGIVNDLVGEAAGTATIEGITRGAGRVIPKVANRMMLSVLKPGRDVIKRNPNLGLEAAEAGIVGSRGGMLSKAENIIDDGENAVSALLKRGGSVDVTKISSELDAIKAPFANVGDDANVAAIEEVQNMLLKKGSISLREANQLKRDLYKVLKDSQYGKGVGEIPAKASARKQAAHGLKRSIEDVVPEVKPVNRRVGVALNAREALENAMANQQRTVLLPKLAGMGAGAAMLTGNPLMAAGIYAGDRLTDAVRSAPMITGAAKNLLRLRRFGKPVSIGGAEAVRRISESG